MYLTAQQWLDYIDKNECCLEFSFLEHVGHETDPQSAKMHF